MNNQSISPLQIIIFILCGLGIVFGVLIFSGKLPIGKESSTTLSGTVTIWGTLPYDEVRVMTDLIRKEYKDLTILYQSKTSNTFQEELVDALASGSGPDLILVGTDGIITNIDRITPFPFASLPEDTFRNTFIDQGGLFINTHGIYALPLAVDPLMMYYNRDLLAGAYLVEPPKTWDELVKMNPQLTKTSDGGALVLSNVALGTFDNITHAKDILVTLIRQTGNALITWDAKDNMYRSEFSSTNPMIGGTTRGAFDFYTQFSNPTSTTHYSWNGNLGSDREQFLFGKLTFYFGYASELQSLRKKNPYLNFSLTTIPQRAASPIKATYGNMIGIAVMKNSPQKSTAFLVAQNLVKKESIQAFLATGTFWVPARRDLLAVLPEDAIKRVIYQSAIIAQGFLDPHPSFTTSLFKTVIDKVNSGESSVDILLSNMDAQLGEFLEKLQKKIPASPTQE